MNLSKKDKAKNRNLIKKYGIDLQKYNEMLEAQNHSCALCKKHKTHFKRSLHVDHNHKTLKVRGLVCFYCNSQLIRRHNKETATKLKLYMDIYE